MIDIQSVLDSVPYFEKFCSVAELHDQVESLRDDPRFTVVVAGYSEQGRPIHHVRFGQGSVKALFVAFVHCSEPIGGMTCSAVLSLLEAGHPALVDADVEWNIVPCIDPDGALLNEDWTQKPFSMGNYMKGFHTQELADQPDMSFPFHYKKAKFDSPTPEALVLKGVLDTVMPDFYYSLHNALAGGAFYFLAHDMGRDRYQAFYDLLKTCNIPLEKNIFHRVVCKEYDESVLSLPLMSSFYDMFERVGAAPESLFTCGAMSAEYLAQIKPEAQTLVVELPYLKHPLCESKKDTGQSLRLLKLRLDAENKYIAATILEEWDKIKDDLEAEGPFRRKIKNFIDSRDLLHEGLSMSPEKTRDLLHNPSYGRTMTEGERFTQHVLRFYMLCHIHEFVRLLKASKQTDRVKSAIARLDAIFGEALADTMRNLDADHIEVVDCTSLAQVQLGNGLVVINEVLDQKQRRASMV